MFVGYQTPRITQNKIRNIEDIQMNIGGMLIVTSEVFKTNLSRCDVGALNQINRVVEEVS